MARRYRFHDLVRAYAATLEQAEESPEARRQCLRRLFDHYVTMARDATALLYPSDPDRQRPAGAAREPTPSLTFPTQRAALAWLDAERANLVAACTAAGSHDHPEVAIELSRLLAQY